MELDISPEFNICSTIVNKSLTPELCMLESKLDDNLALQVVVNGSEFESFLVFRDRLRANSQLIQEYNKLKMACQGLAPNDYREKKSAFIELVLFSA